MAHGVGLADILRDHGGPYLDTHALSVVQDKARRAIVACRTSALGGHVECCDHCGVLRYMYHSCRNRHCPQCQTRAKEAWLAARRRELLPVPYFHLVFTLPHATNGLAGCDARTLYKLLFGAVADTLDAFAANPRWLGFDGTRHVGGRKAGFPVSDRCAVICVPGQVRGSARRRPPCGQPAPRCRTE